MARASSNAPKQQNASKKRAASPKEKSAQRGRAQAVKSSAASLDDDTRILGHRTRREIGAIVLILVAIVLLIMVAMPNDALVTSAVATGLRLTFGVAAYVLPIFLLAVGVVLLVRVNSSLLPARMAIGLFVIYIAVLGILSLVSAGAQPGRDAMLFHTEVLTNSGGYIGSFIAFAGLSLFGQTISIVIMIGIIAIGFAIIGVSVSSIVESIRQKKETATLEETSERLSHRWGRITRGEQGETPVATNAQGFDSDETREIKSVAAAQAKRGRIGHTDAEREPQKTKKQPRVKSGADEASAKNRMSAAETIALTGTEKPLTRQLGHKKTEGLSTSGKQPSKKKSTPKTDIATPRPDEDFVLPSFDMLAKPQKVKGGATEEELQETGATLQETLEDFGIMAEVVGWVAGPTVTLFKINLPAGVRVSRITALNNDIALALAAPGVRIFAPIPGTNYVGIEVPNKSRQTVLLSEVLTDAKPGPLQIAIGKDVEGNSIVSDLAKMPHLLIGGTTGSGKSVSINAMIMSILMRATPSEVRFIMIDPKRVEFTPYNGIPHLYVPVVTEPKEAASALSWGVAEMERRLKEFAKVGARNIGQYNAKAQSGPVDGVDLEELPYIVIIIDELADLMMNVGKEVEFSISRIAQLARAAGIHLIVATQRPSAKVVTGLIKANITNRIAFNVASGIDSRVILDTPGAENLIGLGDLLLSKPELSKPQRIQGCFVSEDEINAVVEHLKEQGSPEYHTEILKTNLMSLGDTTTDGSGGSCGDDDPLIWEAAEIVVSSNLGSTSNLQRRLKVGYSRAGRIMDMLEEKGVVGPANGSKPREVLVDEMELETLKAFESND